jgi:hypothetical protein
MGDMWRCLGISVGVVLPAVVPYLLCVEGKVSGGGQDGARRKYNKEEKD